MENAADALKTAFALLIFVIAFTIVFTMISKVKSTADAVLYYADDTNYQAHTDAKDTNRTVTKSDVISTLYRYYKESIAVTVNINGTQYIFDKGNEKWDSTKLNLNTEEQIESKLGEFMTTILDSIGKDEKFSEEFVEVPISGEYMQGEDGSEIVVSSGGKKVYVTYTYPAK